MERLPLFLIGAFGLGSLALQAIDWRDRQRPEYYLYALALGMGLMGYLIFLLGVLKLLYPSAAWILYCLLAILGIVEIVLNRKEYRMAISQLKFPRQVDWYSLLLVGLLLSAWVYPLLSNALVPPVGRDEVAYHLAIPKLYIGSHNLAYISFIPYANWPHLTELLFTLSLLLSSEPLAQLVTWCALLLTCAALYLFCRRRFEARTGLLAAAIFSTTPMVANLAGTALIELPLTMYTLLAITSIIEWIESGNRRDYLLSACFAGLAASTKLNGVITAALIGCLVVAILIYHRTKFATIALRLAQYGGIAFLVVAPWFAKSWVQTGNPFWPFFQSIFATRNWDALGSEYLFGFIQRPNLPFTPVNWVLGLWKLTRYPADFGPFRVELGWVYLSLLPFTLLAIWLASPRWRTTIRWLIIFGVVFYTSWFFQTHQTRFFMPVTTLLAALVAAGVTWFIEVAAKRLHNNAVSSLLQLGLVGLLVSTSWLLNSADWSTLASRWLYLTGRMTRDQFLLSQVPAYATYQYANANLPPDAYVWMALYENRGYYLDRAYMWANPISQRVLPLEGFANSDELAFALKARGFTHVLFRTDNLANFIYIRYSEQITRLTQDFLDEHTTLLFSASGLNLYAIQP